MARKMQKPSSDVNTSRTVSRFTRRLAGLSAAWRSWDRRRSFFGALRTAALLAVICGMLMGGMVLIASLCMADVTVDRLTTAEAIASDAAAEYDCILVLGAGVWADGSPSPMLYDRVVTACSVYEALHEAHVTADVPLLMSGDHTGDYNEVGVMKKLAVERGIPSEQVFLDHEGYSTYESLYRARYMFGVRKLVIVTQGYHLHRALHIARELGMEAVGVASDLRPYRKQRVYETREHLARFKDMFAAAEGGYDGHLDPPVDLKGDGNLTN